MKSKLNGRNKILAITTWAVSVSTVQSCKLYNSKYMIASAPITSTEILAFTALKFCL